MARRCRWRSVSGNPAPTAPHNGDLVRYPEARAGHLFTLATTTVNPQTALAYATEKDTTS